LIKIENMTDVEWNIYRKNKWNDKLQKENKTFKSVPSDFMVDKNAHIKNLYQEWIQTSVN
jgi:hypothetical protein